MAAPRCSGVQTLGSILLLREAARQNVPYEGAFREAGYVPRSAPPLQYRPLNEEELRAVPGQMARYAGVILTSPRAASRLVSILGRVDMERLRGVPIYCVGPATAAPLRAAGLTPSVPGSGTASSLAESLSLEEEHRPLLFLCGARRLDDLPRILEKRGAAVRELVVYQSEPNPAYVLEGHPRPDWIAFFSPSAVAGLAAFVGERWPTARRAAIGPTTARALERAGLRADAVAAQPTPGGLVRAVEGAASAQSPDASSRA